MTTAVHEFWNEPVGHLHLQAAPTVGPDDTIFDAIALMQERRQGCVCVVDDAGQLKGIFTERDVMSRFVGQSVQRGEPVSQVMSAKPFVVHATDPLSAAVEIFRDEKVHHLPVLHADGTVMGLLSIRVVMDFFAENLPREVLNLPPDSSVISREQSGG